MIMKEISKGFDFREMSQRVLGQTWNSITSEQRDYFVSQMTKLLENVYVGKLESYTGQTIEFVEERIKGNRAQVTTLIENEGVKLPVHYIMQKTGSKWMVYDINIEGVSLIRNYMEQFRSILRQNDFKGLDRDHREQESFFCAKRCFLAPQPSSRATWRRRFPFCPPRRWPSFLSIWVLKRCLRERIYMCPGVSQNRAT